MATIYDIAREAGVSITTVSQVINGKGKISAAKREHVFAVMKQLNYQPSTIAAALAGKKTHTIGLLIPDIANPFFAEIARAVEDRGHQLGYSLFICNTDHKEERIAKYMSVLRQKRVDGIIIGTGMNQQSKAPQSPSLKQSSTPLVYIAREQPGLKADAVLVDDFEGGKLAGEHLISQGHTRLGIIVEQMNVFSNLERIRGFKFALQQAGINMKQPLATTDQSDPVASGHMQAEQWFSHVEPPTALFCCNDLLAVGALQAARKHGLRVPHDLSLIGFDNTMIASITDPPLSTISQPVTLMGHVAVDRLHAQMLNAHLEAARTVLAPELVLRQSTSKIEPSST